MRRIEGILFDLGGTLLREGPFDRMAGRARILELAHNPKGVTLAEYSAEADRFLGIAYGDSGGRNDHAEYSMQAFARVMGERLGLRFDIPLDEIEIEFWRAVSNLEPEPGAAETLDALDRRNVPVGVVSNSVFSGKTLAWELARRGVNAGVRFVLSSADHGRRKPHPSILDAAADRLGVPAAAIGFVGDSLEHDVAGARAAGMTSLWYCPTPRPEQDALCDVVLQDLRDLPRFVGIP